MCIKIQLTESGTCLDHEHIFLTTLTLVTENKMTQKQYSRGVVTALFFVCLFCLFVCLFLTEYDHKGVCQKILPHEGSSVGVQ